MTDLHQCIQNEIEAMSGLVDLLREEQSVLTMAPAPEVMEQLTRITAGKNRLIATINQHGQSRRLLVQRLGFQPIESTMPQWLHGPADKDAWATLVRHTRKANELNRLNGLLINKHLIRNRNTLQVLLSQHRSGTETPALYGANGQSSNRRSVGRTVAA